MSSKNRPGKCHKCGWVYPATYKRNVCKFCGGSVYRDIGPEPGYCKDCGAYCENIYTYQDHRCSKCHYYARIDKAKARPGYAEGRRASARKLLAKQAANADKAYEDWVAQLKQIQTHTLTEDEWMLACKHFGGCALCGADSIDTRMYFIRYKEGGKYNACNIIPACDKCANDLKKNPNPFRTMNQSLNESAGRFRGQNKQRLKGIVDYLQARIEETKK